MKMANVMRGLAVATLFASLPPLACGSDSGNGKSTSNNNKGDGGPSNNNTGGSPSDIPAGSVGCGSKVCSMVDGTMGTACCADAFSSICGINSQLLMGRCVKAPPPEPKECPMLPSIGGFIQLRGCCTAMGECGVDESMLNMGCLNYADAKALGDMFNMMQGGGGMMFNFNVTLPPEGPCTPPPADSSQ